MSYQISATGEFVVGETTLESTFKITVPDYGFDLPEIGSSSPIGRPSYMKAAYIVNWIERGMHVQFEDKAEETKLLFFVLEYNKYVQAYNTEAGSAELSLASKTQAYMMKQLKYIEAVEQKAEDEFNPFKSRTVRRNPEQDGSRKVKREYNNKAIQDRFKKKKPEVAQVIPVVKKPEDVKMFDVFANETAVDPSVASDATPVNSWYKDMDLS